MRNIIIIARMRSIANAGFEKADSNTESIVRIHHFTLIFSAALSYILIKHIIAGTLNRTIDCSVGECHANAEKDHL